MSTANAFKVGQVSNLSTGKLLKYFLKRSKIPQECLTGMDLSPFCLGMTNLYKSYKILIVILGFFLVTKQQDQTDLISKYVQRTCNSKDGSSFNQSVESAGEAFFKGADIRN